MTTNDTATRVARGAAWLDEKYPNWFQSINLDTLKLSDCRQCVLGQVYTGHVPETERDQLIAQVVAIMTGKAYDVEWYEHVTGWAGFAIFVELFSLPNGGIDHGFQANYDDVLVMDNHYDALLDEWTRVIIERRLRSHPDVNDLTCSLSELRVPATVA